MVSKVTELRHRRTAEDWIERTRAVLDANPRLREAWMPDHVDDESFVVLLAAMEVANALDSELMAVAADAIAEALTFDSPEAANAAADEERIELEAERRRRAMRGRAQ